MLGKKGVPDVFMLRDVFALISFHILACLDVKSTTGPLGIAAFHRKSNTSNSTVAAGDVLQSYGKEGVGFLEDRYKMFGEEHDRFVRTRL